MTIQNFICRQSSLYLYVCLQTMDSPIRKKSQKKKNNFCLGAKKTFPLKTFIYGIIFFQKSPYRLISFFLASRRQHYKNGKKCFAKIMAKSSIVSKGLNYASVLCALYSNKTLRNSHPEVFCNKGVIKHFAKFTGKHRRQSLFFNKVAG